MHEYILLLYLLYPVYGFLIFHYRHLSLDRTLSVLLGYPFVSLLSTLPYYVLKRFVDGSRGVSFGDFLIIILIPSFSFLLLYLLTGIPLVSSLLESFGKLKFGIPYLVSFVLLL